MASPSKYPFHAGSSNSRNGANASTAQLIDPISFQMGIMAYILKAETVEETQALERLEIPLHAIMTEDVKSWHASYQPAFRDCIVRKLTHLLVPCNLPPGSFNKYRIIYFAKKTECDLYQRSHSLHEYYNLIVEELYKIYLVLGMQHMQTSRK